MLTDEKETTMENPPATATSAVLGSSESLPEGTPIVRGYDFEGEKVDYDALFASYATTGFQATNFSKAIEIVNHMVREAGCSQEHGRCPLSLYFLRTNVSPLTIDCLEAL